jgi:outer membrane lipoprotein-sorting protein
MPRQQQFASIFLGALCLACVTGRHRPSQLCGTWVLQPRFLEKGEHWPDRWSPRGILTMKEDDTFTLHLEMRVMMSLHMDATGSYTRRGDTITLTGVREGFMNDGYSKDIFQNEPWTMQLKYSKGSLADPGDRFPILVCRREGAKPPPKPKPRPRPSDPRALAIVREMQQRYATLTSYSDEGTLRPSERNAFPGDLNFRTRFARPHRFRFQVVAIEGGKPWERNIIWSNGKKSRWYSEHLGYGGTHERALISALCTIAPTSGTTSMLVPSLLLPVDFDGPTVEASSEGLSLEGEEQVSGKDCYVIGINGPDGLREKLWIEKSRYLILRVIYTMPPTATITYQPKRNIKIPESEFEFSPPK